MTRASPVPVSGAPVCHRRRAGGGGSSPSTIALHDLERASTRSVVTLSHDIRNAIHGLEVWPFDPV